VIHTSVHQPVDRPPGLSLFGYGQFFNRLESWSDYAGSWIKYIARSSYLLQQGKFAADVAYFYGEEAPITSLFGNKRVEDVPQEYGFDFVDSDALINQLSVDRGTLVTKSGMRYRVLYLGGSSRMMTLPTLSRIRDLVKQGATLVGRRPAATPSLGDDTVKFQTMADELFGDGSDHTYGRGRMFPGGSLADAFAAIKLPPDFEYTKPQAGSEILYLHRRLADGDLYFVSNRQNSPENFTATFRVTGYSPEIWNAVTGEITKAPYTAVDGRTKVPLALPAYGSVFVVFREHTSATSRARTRSAIFAVAALKGPWTVAFQPNRGAPAKIVLQSLQSWSDSKVSGVKYFSGTGVYINTFMIPKSAFKPRTRLTLDLGEVRELADVSLNGKSLGTVWTPPFALDITKAARPGRNVLKVKVANLWVNRLIGDAQSGIRKKYTFTTIPTYKPAAPLRESGLLGPVMIRRVH
jgi:hypothetical protein